MFPNRIPRMDDPFAAMSGIPVMGMGTLGFGVIPLDFLAMVHGSHPIFAAIHGYAFGHVLHRIDFVF